MPQFDLRGIRVAEYLNGTYGPTLSAGDAMTANFDLRFAEGRLYAESTLAEYIRKATGGTISLGTKYIPNDAQVLMYGKTRTAKVLSNGKVVQGLKTTAKDKQKYVGVSFYAPDMIDGEEKYTCVFIHRALFGPPSMSLQTQGDNITFQTPTTSGEFLSNRMATDDLIDTAVADTEADAILWTYEVMGDTATLSNNANLAGIYIGNMALAPAFAASTTSYTATATNASDYVTVIADDPHAAVEIKVGTTVIENGSRFTWNTGSNSVKITVRAEDDTTTKTYTVTVTKGA